MDELELLKQDWQREKPNEFPHYSEKELFQMSKKNSVSIAKWVFVIGVLEILFWFGLDWLLGYYFPSSGEESPYIFLETFIDIFDYISMAMPYVFLGIVIFLYYKIKNTEEPKRLMKKIMWMKQAIHWYIKLFLIQIIIFAILVFSIAFLVVITDKDTIHLPLKIILAIFFLFIVGAASFGLVVIFKHIYYFIYGRFIKQLEENYQELSKIETQETSE